jgi:hypothetical protein
MRLRRATPVTDLLHVDARASVAVRATSVAGAISDARAEAEKYRETDPTFSELMLTYVALGEVLEANRHITSATAATLPTAEVQDYEDECRAHMTRLIQLERPLEFEHQQRWSRWRVQNMEGGA